MTENKEQEKPRKHKVFFYSMEFDGVCYLLPEEIPRVGEIINLPDDDSDSGSVNYKVIRVMRDFCHLHDSKVEKGSKLMHQSGDVHISIKMVNLPEEE